MMIPFRVFTLPVVGALVLAIACLTSPCRVLAQQTEPLPSAKELTTIAVMPFLKGGSDARTEKNLEKTLDCQLRGLCYLEEELQTDAEKELTRIFQKELKKRVGEKVIPLAQVETAYHELERAGARTPRQIGLELGRKLRVSHVLVGLVSRYQERVGSPLTALSPASVAFSAYLLDVEGGTLVRRSSFRKTQTSLSENLFDAPMYFKKGIKWLSVEELATYGADRIMKDLF